MQNFVDGLINSSHIILSRLPPTDRLCAVLIPHAYKLLVKQDVPQQSHRIRYICVRVGKRRDYTVDLAADLRHRLSRK